VEQKIKEGYSSKLLKQNKMSKIISYGDILNEYQNTTDGLWLLDALESKHPIMMDNDQVNMFVKFIDALFYHKKKFSKLDKSTPIISYEENGRCTLNLR
jgi:hypothetical protein